MKKRRQGVPEMWARKIRRVPEIHEIYDASHASSWTVKIVSSFPHRVCFPLPCLRPDAMRIGVTARPAIALYYSGRALGEHYETLQVVSTRDDHENRVRSPIHYGAVWLQVIEKPAQKLEGHYWTDRNTAGELRLTDRRKQKFQDFNSAKAHDER